MATPEELVKLKQQLENLKKARRSGAQRVRFGERDVIYKSEDEMRQVQRELEAEIAREEGVVEGVRRRRRTRSTLTTFRTGY